MRITTLSILLFVLALTAKAQPTPKGPLSHDLVGEWYNLYVHIKLSNGAVMEADSANWEARLQIKPIHTFFQADGSYYSEYRNLQDSIVRRPTGNWTIRGDSLIMRQTTPQTSTMTLHLTIDNGVATFSGLIDFDGEGKDNDEYLGKQRRKKATNL